MTRAVELPAAAWPCISLWAQVRGIPNELAQSGQLRMGGTEVAKLQGKVRQGGAGAGVDGPRGRIGGGARAVIRPALTCSPARACRPPPQMFLQRAAITLTATLLDKPEWFWREDDSLGVGLAGDSAGGMSASGLSGCVLLCRLILCSDVRSCCTSGRPRMKTWRYRLLCREDSGESMCLLARACAYTRE